MFFFSEKKLFSSSVLISKYTYRWVLYYLYRRTKCKLVKKFSLGKIPAWIVIIEGKFKNKMVVSRLMHLCLFICREDILKQTPFNLVFFLNCSNGTSRRSFPLGFVLDLELWYHFWVVCVLFVQFSVCQCRMIGIDRQINQLNVFCVCRWVHSVVFRFRFAFGDETFIGKSSQTSRTYHIWMANYSLGTRRHFYACIHSKLCGRQYMYVEPPNVHGILSIRLQPIKLFTVCNFALCIFFISTIGFG